MLSNETVNIWSHLLGFLLFFSLGVQDLSTVLPASGAKREDYVIYTIGLFCFQVRVTGIPYFFIYLPVYLLLIYLFIFLTVRVVFHF